MNIGGIIRKQRKEKKMTLKVVAEKVGISEGFLSQVENNVNSPSVDTLISICNVIGINTGDLFNQAEKQEKVVLIKKEEWDEFEIPHTGFVTRRFFTPEYRVDIDSAILVIDPGKSIPVRKSVKNSQEIISVLKGSVTLLHGDTSYTLNGGDSVHFWTDPARQSLSNTGSGRAIVLWVGTF